MSIDRVNISNQGIDRSHAAQPNELTRSAGKERQVSAGSDSIALSARAAELLRLERAKHDALIVIDAPAYDLSVREQMRLLAASKDSIPQAESVDQLLAL